MDDTKNKQLIAQFLDSQKLGVIATIHADHNAPESALVGFANTDKLELIFGTSRHTRKYTNLQNTTNVSFVIGWEPQIGTLQYEGTARELNAEEKSSYRELILARNPYHQNFIDTEDQKYFLVTPSWIRLVDNTKQPAVTTELLFE